jgi:hypothetical protein
MAAGVHPTRPAAGVGNTGRFLNRQRVHVGAQADCALAIATPQHANHAMAANATMRLDPPALQQLGDDPRRARHLQPELRVGVQIAADRRQVGVIAADFLEGG